MHEEGLYLTNKLANAQLTTHRRRWAFDIKLITEPKSDDQGLKLVWDPQKKYFEPKNIHMWDSGSVPTMFSIPVNFQFVSSRSRKNNQIAFIVRIHTRGAAVKRGR